MGILPSLHCKQPPSSTTHLRLFIVVVSLFLEGVTPVSAADILDIYKAALKNDPVYQAAVSTRLSIREAIPQSIAALLPNISGTASLSTHYQTTTQTPSGEPFQGLNQFQSQSYNISITQPLINIKDWLAVKQANSTSKQADVQFAATAQDLILRVAKAYFQVLLAQDNLHLAQAEKAANAKQFDQAKKRVQAGLDVLTTAYEAEASYDKSLAIEITAQNTLRNSQEALRQLTGQTYASLASFKAKIPLLTPQPAQIERWIDTATKDNLSLMATRYAMEIARDNIKMKTSGHLPTISLVGNYGRGDRLNTGMINKDSSALGLQLDIPLFSGGAVVSKTHQAQYDFQTASANLENTYRQVIVTTRQQYNDVLADISKIKAERQAVKSAQYSLDSTEESYKAGTRTIVDVLISQQNLYDAKRNAANDQYGYLLDTLLLKQTAGILKPDDLKQINQWLLSPAT